LGCLVALLGPCSRPSKEFYGTGCSEFWPVSFHKLRWPVGSEISPVHFASVCGIVINFVPFRPVHAEAYRSVSKMVPALTKRAGEISVHTGHLGQLYNTGPNLLNSVPVNSLMGRANNHCNAIWQPNIMSHHKPYYLSIDGLLSFL